MSSWDSLEAFGAAASDHWSEIAIGRTLQGQTDSYIIQDWLGEGGFGRVAKCQALRRKQNVAVKITKDFIASESMKAEISMLEKVRLLDPERKNLVHFFECFEFMGVDCLVLEMLDVDLFTFINNRGFIPLQMSEIRPIAQQLLVALEALKGAGILHCDIKPDNVMFTNLEDEPLRIKLIDFGEAMSISEVHPGMEFQPVGYRAPEISLGLPFTEAVDAWGVGCLLAFLYLADNLFPVHCEYQQLKRTVELLGQPDDLLLQKGKHSPYFFCEVQTTEGTAWRLLSPEEFSRKNYTSTEERKMNFDFPNSLDDLHNEHSEDTAAKEEDKRAFVDLLKGLLCLDGEQRLTPQQALQLPFITMAHLHPAPFQGYATVSKELMQICALKEAASLTTDAPCVPVILSDDAESSGSPDNDSGIWSIWLSPTPPPGCQGEHEPAPVSSGEVPYTLQDLNDVSNVQDWISEHGSGLDANVPVEVIAEMSVSSYVVQSQGPGSHDREESLSSIQQLKDSTEAPEVSTEAPKGAPEALEEAPEAQGTKAKNLRRVGVVLCCCVRPQKTQW